MASHGIDLNSTAKSQSGSHSPAQAHEDDLEWADADLVEPTPAAPARVAPALPLEIPHTKTASASQHWAWDDDAPAPAAPARLPREPLPTLDLPAHAPSIVVPSSQSRPTVPPPALVATAPAAEASSDISMLSEDVLLFFEEEASDSEPASAAASGAEESANRVGHHDALDGDDSAPELIFTARVPFESPLLVQRDDEDEAHEGRVFNLSEEGLAGVLPVTLRVGEQIWASFGLGAGAAPVTALSRVTWKGKRTGDGTPYGFSFERVSERDRERLQDVLTEHVAAAAEEDVEPRALSPWLAGGIGLALGILLTAGVQMFLGAGDVPLEGHRVRPQVAQAPEPTPAPADALEQPGASAQPVAEPTPPTEPVPAPVEVAKAPEAAPSTPAAADPSLLPPKAAAPASASGAPVLRPMGGPDSMPLALLCDGPVDQHITFWLSNPRRLVVDIPGRHSGFKHLQYDVDHPLASRLRVGDHPGKVRFVLETSEAVAPEVITTVQGNALAIELRRK